MNVGHEPDSGSKTERCSSFLLLPLSTRYWYLEALGKESKRKVEVEGIPEKYDGPLATHMEGYRRVLKLINVLVNARIALYNITIGKLPLALGKKEYIHSDHEAKTPRKMLRSMVSLSREKAANRT